MMTPEIDVTFAENIEYDLDALLSLIDEAIAKTIQIAKLEFVKEAEVSFLIADDETLKSLNLEWRGKDKPTNVLSFATDIVKLGHVTSPLLGDIAISLQTAHREADLENKTFEHHLSHLIIHGFLHLFGYDHETDIEAKEMETLETKILKELDIADPYN